jgi:hypothetical protein
MLLFEKSGLVVVRRTPFRFAACDWEVVAAVERLSSKMKEREKKMNPPWKKKLF